MPFDPDKYLAAAPPSGAGFDPDKYLGGPAKPAEPEEQSALDTVGDVGRSIEAGASEIGRGVPILGPLAAKAGYGLSAALTKATPDSLLPEEWRGKTLGELYDAYKAADQAAEAKKAEQHPLATGLGQAAGAIATPLPGAGMGGLAGATTRIGSNAVISAADAAARDQSPADVAEAGALSGGITAGLEALPVVGKAAGYLGKKAGRVLTGVPEQAAEHYLANPEAVNAAKPLAETTKAFLESADEIGGKLSGDSSKAYAMLSEHAAPVADLTNPLAHYAGELDALGAFGQERKGTIKFLQGLADDVTEHAGAEGQITLDKGKGLIAVIDAQIQKLQKTGTDAQSLKALTMARRSLDDYLKSSVPAYAEHMEQLATKTGALTDLTDRFRTENGAQNTLKRIQTGKDQFAGEALQGFDDQFGTAFGQDLKNSYTKGAFDRDTTAGSRKTLLGSVVGSAVGAAAGGPFGGAIGSAAGAAAGATADKYGGRIYKAILDGTLKAGKYAAPLQQLYQARGPAAVAAAHAILMKRDPEYANAAKEAGDQQAIDQFLGAP